MSQKLLAIPLAFTLAYALPVSARGHRASLGLGHGIVRHNPGLSAPCPGSQILMNADGSYETGEKWDLGGEVAPYYGAFAEGHTGSGTLCGVQLALTTVPRIPANQPLDTEGTILQDGHSLMWDGLDEAGGKAGIGVFLCTFLAGKVLADPEAVPVPVASGGSAPGPLR